MLSTFETANANAAIVWFAEFNKPYKNLISVTGSSINGNCFNKNLLKNECRCNYII